MSEDGCTYHSIMRIKETMLSDTNNILSSFLIKLQIVGCSFYKKACLYQVGRHVPSTWFKFSLCKSRKSRKVD